MRTGSNLRYVFADHLGSSTVTADVNGADIKRQLYKAFGETRSTTTVATRYAYTGQFAYDDQSTEFGLLFFRARFIDASLGRFVSADSVIPEASQGVQAWDRYAGMNNNPLKYVDPGGHKACDGDFETSDDCWVYTADNDSPYFIQLPVSDDDLDGVQWFGATQRAHDLWEEGNGIYSYCQGMHCGLDLLAPYGTPVYAGVYGEVYVVNSVATGPARFEGPYKIIIEVEGGYFITYGHTDGTAFVKRGDNVTPDTMISGVGNMGGFEGSGEIDHIHLEIRGPGNDWYGGPSNNPINYMSKKDLAVLVDVAKIQEIQVEMSRFGYTGIEYPGLPGYSPATIERKSSSVWK